MGWVYWRVEAGVAGGVRTQYVVGYLEQTSEGGETRTVRVPMEQYPDVSEAREAVHYLNGGGQ